MKRYLGKMARLATVLIVCLILSSVVIWAATDTSKSFQIELLANGCTSALVGAGDEVTFQVKLSRTDEGRSGSFTLYSMQDEIIYDSRYFSFVEGSQEPAASFDFNIRTLDDGVTKRIIISRLVMGQLGVMVPDDLVIASFKLKAIASIAEGSVLSRNAKVNTRDGDTYITTTNDVNVTVTGLSPAHHALRFIGNDSYNALPDGTKLMVLTAKSKLSDHVFDSGGQAMFYSPLYSKPDEDSYVYLSAVANEVTEADALADIQILMGHCPELFSDKDVNGDGIVNSTDAVLIFGLYGGRHAEDSDFSKVSLRMRLEADVNGDGIVNTCDAISVLNFLWRR